MRTRALVESSSNIRLSELNRIYSDPQPTKKMDILEDSIGADENVHTFSREERGVEDERNGESTDVEVV